VPDVSWQHVDACDQVLEENWLFRLRRERYRSRASGKEHDFYVMQLANAVNVVALTPERRLVLVRQFRAGSGRDSLETPGGLVAEGEDPREAGARELLEETGYAGDPPQHVGTLWSNPSLLTSKVITIVITNARRVSEPSPDHAEELEIELVAAHQVPQMIHDGRLDHSLAVCGLLWWLVSELPGPLAMPRSRPFQSRQTRVANVMMSIAAFALLLAFVANLGKSRLEETLCVLGLLCGIVAIPVLMVTLILKTLMPHPPATLRWAATIARVRRIGRMLTIYGR